MISEKGVFGGRARCGWGRWSLSDAPCPCLIATLAQARLVSEKYRFLEREFLDASNPKPVIRFKKKYIVGKM